MKGKGEMQRETVYFFFSWVYKAILIFSVKQAVMALKWKLYSKDTEQELALESETDDCYEPSDIVRGE